MATIYLQPTGNGLGDNTLILEPREALVYPFDFGNDWKTLAMGMFYSYCGLSGNDSTWSTEIVADPETTTLLNNYFFGFTNYNNPFPSAANNSYVGLYFRQGYVDMNSIGYPGAGNTISRIDCSIFTSGQRRGSGPSALQATFPDRTAMNLPTGYAGFLGVKISSNFDSGSAGAKEITGGIRRYTNSNEFPIYSINNLEKEITNGVYFGNSSAINKYWTSDGESGSPVLPRPNAILIYSPFINNKLRIHSIMVTRLT